MFPQTQRTPYDMEKLLAPIPGDSPVGQWLRYEPIYDEIRQARSQENPRLSQGVWKREIKSADWAVVEKLATNILSTQSKDLQIMAWLIEAWAYLDGMEGAIRGFHVMAELTKAFWKDIFPYPEEPEARMTLFEWLDESLSEHMFFFAITLPKDEYAANPWTLADWRHAQRLQQIFNRSTDARREAQRAQEVGEPVLSAFEQSVDQTDAQFFHEGLEEIAQFRQTQKVLKDTLESVWGYDAPSFKLLSTVLNDFEQIWKTALIRVGERDANQPEKTIQKGDILPAMSTGQSVSKSTPPQEGMDRDRAYKQLQDIADILERLEPQSLTPYVLRGGFSREVW